MSTAVTTSDLRSLLDALSLGLAASGLTQKALAEGAGLTEKHVSQMMTGKVDGRLQAWEALADAAGLRIEITIRQASA